ncbi:uncharacterized protein LOC143852025 isoform X2 [Tasmannia lanceolata]|uniref:uncharacterized protein LOC143852025 isoform X2 n=1 Tax=Tasmannia lanceolata TaxID=3420 RepID=UPI0040646866
MGSWMALNKRREFELLLLFLNMIAILEETNQKGIHLAPRHWIQRDRRDSERSESLQYRDSERSARCVWLGPTTFAHNYPMIRNFISTIESAYNVKMKF